MLILNYYEASFNLCFNIKPLQSLNYFLSTSRLFILKSFEIRFTGSC